MKYGTHGMVWSACTDARTVDLAVRKTAEAGFDIIEIPLLDPASFDVDAALRSVEGTGLQVTASLGLSRDSDITSEDLDCVKAGEVKLLRCVEILHALHGTHLVGDLYGELRKYPAPVTPAARANGQGVLRTVAAAATEAGVAVGLEVVNRYESNMLNTARQALAYVDELNTPNVAVHLDTYHMNIEESDMFSPVLACGPRLCYVHMGESHRGYLGSGNVDFRTFFRALSVLGYDGPMVFESFSTTVVHPDLSLQLAVWRNLWQDSDDLARHALAFMRAGVHAVDTIRMQ
ncbi:MAG: sugar phosphate isomerase/epimerase [Micrococcales bacterium]|nr:sugar phosphate isomerase/epimerase [Micrococcales bacterium]